MNNFQLIQKLQNFATDQRKLAINLNNKKFAKC